MTAGQCERLCAEAAEEVMGWAARSMAWAYSDSAVVWHSQDAIPLVAQHAWRPDEDDVQCMQVIDRMLGLGFRCRIRADSSTWTVSFARGAPARDACHPQRRIAVLKAAVEAVVRER